MTKIDLGKVAPIYKGTYDSSTSYNELDIVFDNTSGRSFIAKQPAKGNSLPTEDNIENDYWGLVAEKGEPGKKGEVGPTGPQGKQGTMGPSGEQGPKGDRGETGPKGDRGDTGPQGKDWQDKLVESISGDTIFDLDKVTFDLNKGNKQLVINSIGQPFSSRVTLPSGTKTISYGADLKFSTGVDGKKDSTKFTVNFFDKDNNFISSYKPPYFHKSFDLKSIKYEAVPVPDNATAIRFRMYADIEHGGIATYSRPQINVGSSLLDYSQDSNNLIQNPNFANDAANWFSDNDNSIPLDKTTTFIKVLQDMKFYKIENSTNIKGTLPDGLIVSALNGATLVISQSTDSGFGGISQTLFVGDGIYTRTFSYMWSNWVKQFGNPLGGFNSAGVWISPFGDVVKGGTVYDFYTHEFYALATDGTALKNITEPTKFPISNKFRDTDIRTDSRGAILDDITNNQVTLDYIETVNNKFKTFKPDSINVVVSDTHGTSESCSIRGISPLLTGVQFGKGLGRGVHAKDYYTANDIAEMNTKYYKNISRQWVNRTAKNIKKITTKITNNAVYSHLGDIEDGHNVTVADEIKSYNEAMSTFRNENWNIIDGNHDEQPYAYESQNIYDGTKRLIKSIPNVYRSRLVDTDKFRMFYNRDSSYFSVRDGNVVYIYLDIFEGGKLVRKDGSTNPDYGEYKKGGKLTKKQINWLIDTLYSLNDTDTVIVNGHTLPDSDSIGKKPAGEDKDGWMNINVNTDILGKILVAFQHSTKYKGSTSSVGMDIYDMGAYNVTVDVDFTGHTKDRIALLLYGHYHTNGHITKKDNGNFNIIQVPKMLGPGWDRIGSTDACRFTIIGVNTSNRQIYVNRFSDETSIDDVEFTLDY